jgi:hypothetical protein
MKPAAYLYASSSSTVGGVRVVIFDPGKGERGEEAFSLFSGNNY